MKWKIKFMFQTTNQLATGVANFDPSKISGRSGNSQRPRIGAAWTHSASSDLHAQRGKAKDLGLGTWGIPGGNPGKILGKSWEN